MTDHRYISSVWARRIDGGLGGGLGGDSDRSLEESLRQFSSLYSCYTCSGKEEGCCRICLLKDLISHTIAKNKDSIVIVLTDNGYKMTFDSKKITVDFGKFGKKIYTGAGEIARFKSLSQ